MKAPFLYKGDKPLSVSAETVFTVVKSIMAAGEEASFLKACEKKKAGVTVAPEFVNLVKMYLFKKRVHKENVAAVRVIKSARCTPG